MKLIPIESKQILFCSYDESEGTIRLHFWNGRIESPGTVDEGKVKAMIKDQNRYDALIRLVVANSKAAR